jgi:Na+/proline symporter
MILLYTLEGGVKTIIYTDTLQTTGMLMGLVISVVLILKALHLNVSDAWSAMQIKGYTQLINPDWKSGSFFMKHILGGMFIAITMTGLDQEMMQKNISVKNLKDSQKNMMTFTAILLLVNFLFLFLGGLLQLFAAKNNINVAPDDLFPFIAIQSEMAGALGILFIIALISALFPSVDGAITSLTSSYCMDLLGWGKTGAEEPQKKRTRIRVHLSFALIFFLMVLLFKWINDKLIIDFILKFAGITYGPLLGLFAFGILTKRGLKEKFVIPVCLLAPILALLTDICSSPEWYEAKLHITLGLNNFSATLFHGYKIGNELIIINGLITCILLYAISLPPQKMNHELDRA